MKVWVRWEEDYPVIRLDREDSGDLVELPQALVERLKELTPAWDALQAEVLDIVEEQQA